MALAQMSVNKLAKDKIPRSCERLSSPNLKMHSRLKFEEGDAHKGKLITSRKDT